MADEVKTPFDAVAIRYVHDIATGEFLNVGMLVVCQDRRFAAAKFLDGWGRVTSAFPGADPVHLRRVRDAVETSCAMWSKQASGLQMEPLRGAADLFYHAVPRDDASLTLSGTLRGLTADPDRTLRELFVRYVGKYLVHTEPLSRDDADVWRGFEQRVKNPSILKQLMARRITAPGYEHIHMDLEHSWKNGVWNAAHPLSLDLTSPRAIQKKATELLATLELVQPKEHGFEVTILVGLPPSSALESVRGTAADGLRFIKQKLAGAVRAMPEECGDELAEKLVKDLSEH